ncbi:NTP transferase domain-containing protein [Beggiatoa leptomitoformis]|uniref:NTP transferase domain-containing protein n=2 Tax=Beggiatoa leptomitoformis TaxID=288004 RepID=A0A2N9YJK3_9GAMM|nr:NTP transferase domain-containing protein [Beggiatoa leptomitoformis]AUI70668.1 NTP transferase domain-containing protein [Beggiatoa leptomitoformis]
MRAMILAAGRGERMRPLTDTCPKPLLQAGGKALIEHHIERLVNAGFTEIIINHAWLGEKIEQTLGDGSHYGATFFYSRETQALETGGGIYQALPLLGNAPFLVVNGDIWCDYPFARFHHFHLQGLAHLVLVDNPIQHPSGDFYLENATVSPQGEPRLTFSGIAYYHPILFKNCTAGKFSIVPLLLEAMKNQQVSGEHYHGKWLDIGTPERLALLNALIVV